MAECIEREKLKEAFENADPDVCENYPDGYSDWGFGRQNIRDVINSIPAADVAPVVHGRWEWLGPNRLVTDCMCGTCSACKVRSKYIVNTMLCPNCGAKMDGDGNADH